METGFTLNLRVIITPPIPYINCNPVLLVPQGYPLDHDVRLTGKWAIQQDPIVMFNLKFVQCDVHTYPEDTAPPWPVNNCSLAIAWDLEFRSRS